MPAAIARILQRHWWRPRLTPLTALLAPLAFVVGAVAARRRASARAQPLPVPVIVVGNVIVGGAGKTPSVIALVALLRSWGYAPGIVSRGHGRADARALLLDATTPRDAATAVAFGDEPLLMHRRTGAPIAVARRRRDAAVALLRTHPEVDVIVADDGLQHHALARDIELVVFDDRGMGNGWPLPAGPLRERASAIWPAGAPAVPRFILVNGHWPAAPARALPAPRARCFEAGRGLGGALSLADWSRGDAASRETLAALRGRPLLAAAGIGDPERFFAMLEAEGLAITRLPLADHAAFDTLPWPAATPDVIVTEKDAVKLARHAPGPTRIWVATLDFGLPDDLARALRDALPAPSRPPDQPQSPQPPAPSS
jgi:tetraacyldisaccharide 4'-kinase